MTSARAAMLTIFDCDGVLVDSEGISLSVLADMVTGLGHPMSVAECQVAFMGMHNADILRAIESRLGRSLPPDEGARLRTRMIERLKRELKPVLGAEDALARLEGARCVASSSDPERIRLTLTLTGLDGFFGGHIFSGTEVAHGKPAPDLFLKAAATMGFAPGDCLVIEDSTAGVIAAVRAGMRVIGFTGGSHTDPGHAERLREAGAESVVAGMADLSFALAEALAVG